MFIAHLRDGRTMKEDTTDWKQVPQEDITSLQVAKHGRLFTVTADGKNVKFLQLKRNLLDTAKGTDSVVERVIGVIVEDVAVKMVIDERTGYVKLTVEKKEDGKWRKL